MLRTSLDLHLFISPFKLVISEFGHSFLSCFDSHFCDVFVDKVKIVEILIKHGANVNAKNIIEASPLLVAVENGKVRLNSVLKL